MKLPDCPKAEHEYHHDRCQDAGTVNGGVFSIPEPEYLATMTGLAGAGVSVTTADGDGDGDGDAGAKVLPHPASAAAVSAHVMTCLRLKSQELPTPADVGDITPRNEGIRLIKIPSIFIVGS
jgi:hypothetical protein